MTKEQAQKLQSLHENGYVVIIDGYVVAEVIEAEDTKDPEELRWGWKEGDLIFVPEGDSEWSNITGYSISDVTVAAPIDWLDILHDSQYPLDQVYSAIIENHDITDYAEDLRNAYDEAGD